MRNNTFETTVAVAGEVQLTIIIATLTRNVGKETVVTKNFRIPHNQLLPKNQGRRKMIRQMLQRTPLDRGNTSLRLVEDLIPDEHLRLCSSNQQAFFYFYAIQDADSTEEDVFRYVFRTKIMGTTGYKKFLRKSRAMLFRCSAAKKVEGVVASSAEKSSCAICLTELCGDAEEIAGRLPCSHLFHFECIIRWLMRSNSCPLCRSQPAPPSS